MKTVYHMNLFIPPRTPLKCADSLADTLETIGNTILSTPYPYELDLSNELCTLEIQLEKCKEETGFYQRCGNVHGSLEVAENAYRALGVQALKIAHILEQFRIQQENEVK